MQTRVEGPAFPGQRREQNLHRQCFEGARLQPCRNHRAQKAASAAEGCSPRHKKTPGAPPLSAKRIGWERREPPLPISPQEKSVILSEVERKAFHAVEGPAFPTSAQPKIPGCPPNLQLLEIAWERTTAETLLIRGHIADKWGTWSPAPHLHPHSSPRRRRNAGKPSTSAGSPARLARWGAECWESIPQ